MIIAPSAYDNYTKRSGSMSSIHHNSSEIKNRIIDETICHQFYLYQVIHH